jgi:hypothetical protein
MRLGAVHMQANRQPASLDHRHDFRAFADLRLAYAIAPLQNSRPERLAPILVFRLRPVGSGRCAKSVPMSHPATIRSVVASRCCPNHTPAVGLPTHSLSSTRIKCHSRCDGRHCVADHVCSSSLESAVQAPPIVRRLDRVCSCLYFSFSRHF